MYDEMETGEYGVSELTTDVMVSGYGFVRQRPDGYVVWYDEYGWVEESESPYPEVSLSYYEMANAIAREYA